MTAGLSGDRRSALVWDIMRVGFKRRIGSLAAFGLLYAILMLLGLGLSESSHQLTCFWPAGGLLFIALRFSPRRNWIWVLGVQIAVEIVIDSARFGSFARASYTPFVVANSLDGIVGALVAKQLMTNPDGPEIGNVLRFFAAAALGAAASAMVGAYGAAQVLGGAGYWREWQVWWAGNWLGSLCIAPVVMTWAIRWRRPELTAPPAPALETTLIGCVLVGMTLWVFSATPGSITMVLDLPFLLLALVIVAAFRLPPRWCSAFVAAAAFVASYYGSRGFGPFAGYPTYFMRIDALQLYLATLAVVSLMLAVVLVEMRKTVQLLRTSGESLRQKQDRLQLYARQLVGAEERARRATAVDLHDGIGQHLAGLAMTLNAATSRAPAEVRLLLGEATHTVREVQSITQKVIADLSPPGLYELGLEPALQWLSVYMRGKDNLQVDLRVDADAAAYNLELRVLVFKLIRELLRNVVKHSGVQSAVVTVTQAPNELSVVVEDRGVGFEWQLSLFEARSGGFGLWSVADRVRAASGEMTVDTAPGRGCRVSVVFPHEETHPPIQRRDSGSSRSAAS